jgi:hypothetical protein
MIVSSARQFVFVHNPKSAGTSFRAAIADLHDDPVVFWGLRPAPYFGTVLDFAHLRAWELVAMYPRLADAAAAGNSLIFVRNPYHRFLSAFREYFSRYHPDVPLSVMSPAGLAGLVEAFLPEITRERILSDHRFVHFSPQIWFIRYGEREMVRHVLPMGTVPEAFFRLGLEPAPVGWENSSPVDMMPALGSGRVLQFVETLYEGDLAYLQAEPALAGLAAVPKAVSPAASAADNVCVIAAG